MFMLESGVSEQTAKTCRAEGPEDQNWETLVYKTLILYKSTVNKSSEPKCMDNQVSQD